MTAFYPSIDIQLQALRFIVLEDDAFKLGERANQLASDEVTRHLGIEHKQCMKVINELGRKGWVHLRPRLSPGFTGYGWDGSAYGAVSAREDGKALVRAIDARAKRKFCPF